MKKILALIILISAISYGQPDERISTIDFVQILNGHKAETMYYYENNWKALRLMALKKGYIHSFQLLEVPEGEGPSFHLMLITTYSNKAQYNLREDHFSELIKVRGKLRLMNGKQPGEFRKTLFGREMVRHWY